MSDSPALIYLALSDWFSSARLPKYLNRAGFNLIGICTAASPLTQVRHFHHRQVIGPGALRTTLEALTKRFQPELIIPADEGALHGALAIQRSCQEIPGSLSVELCRLLARSFGGTATSKQRINEIAADLGIHVPKQRVISKATEAEAFAREVGYPIVLKKENTHGGMGVLLCRNGSEIVTNFFRLQASSRFRRSVAKFGISSAARVPSFRAAISAWSGSTLIAQQYVLGRPAFRTFVANEGRELAGMVAVAERVNPTPFGASTVVSFIENADIARATKMLIRKLGITGFGGVDFLLEAGSDHAVLLELNPRVTPTAHLGSLLGVDLCAALMAELTGEIARNDALSADLVSQRRVVLFPNELMRDMSSEYLYSAYHDVPHDEPELIAAWRASIPQPHIPGSSSTPGFASGTKNAAR